MSYPKVLSVMFQGSINIDGRMGNNLEADRDNVALFFHEATGGLIVEQGSKQHYVAPMSVMSLTFAEPLVAKVDVETDAVTPSPQNPSVQQAEHDAVSNNSALADSVLAEFQEDKEATPQPKPKRKPHA